MHRLFFATAIVLMATGSVRAAAITYTESATGTGSFNGVGFTNQLITIVATGDTSNISHSQVDPSVLHNIDSVTTVTVTGFGIATFSDLIEAFVNPNSPAGAGIEDLQFGDIFDTRNAAFSAYDLSKSFGPVSGMAADNPGLNLKTNLGPFVIASISGNSTFTATVPEPASAIAFGALVYASGLLSRRHIKREKVADALGMKAKDLLK